MSAGSFAHLHVHTEYSMLDGAARLKQLAAEAARLEMPAVAMSDHGNVFAAADFYKQVGAAGVKPIIGMEAYVAPTSRYHKQPVFWGEHGQRSDDVAAGGAYTHITLLAENATGLRNLFRLASRASMEGNYKKARLDRELLAAHAQGIIATTGCPSGEVQTRLRLGQYEQAREAAAAYRDIVGRENYFLELMDHGIDIERRVRDDLLRLGKELELPPLASNDSHYTSAADATAHEVLLCVQTGKTLADPGRFKLDGGGYYLKTAEEMRTLWDGQVEGACDNTLAIAERVGSYAEVFAHQDLMPRVPVPDGHTEDSWLAAEVERGLARRFPAGVPEAHREQARYELGVIAQMGFPGYFLVVGDLCRHARQSGIRVGPGRGSAAGSLVAYAMGITDLDPVEHRLIFERFLNPERVSMPDIDLDFDERRRGDMIRYATEKYGEDRVSQIVTYGRIQAKQAIKDSSRVLGYPFSMGDRITKVMPPPVMGKDIPLAGIFDPAHSRYREATEFRALVDAEPDVKKIVDTAMGLEGLVRQPGVHAAGVILSREPLLDVIPVWRREQDGAIITQFDMGVCESLGLLKMDFLGLRNLTILEDCLANIRSNRGQEVVLEDLELTDTAAYELLARGDTLGVFQLDGGPMRALLRSMRPTAFEDISAVLALYRPGPMGANAHNEYADRKNGRKKVVPIHPELAEPLEDILGETFGLIVYQEQVMAIAQKVAGYSLGAADLLRRAMGKKKKEILDKEYIPFSEGMKANGFSDGAIKTLWDILVPFSDYAFNRAHTAGYGLVAYWTAYLKANYPVEYMAALLTSVKDDKDKSAVYLNECRRMGLKVLPPDVNESGAHFLAVGADIRFGLAAIRNVGEKVVASIVATRKGKGAFADFSDFLGKIDPIACNKKVVESLVKAGAFDSLQHHRRGLISVFEMAVDRYAQTKKAESTGQFDLFGESSGGPDDVLDAVFAVTVPDGEWDKTVKLAFEREMLGLYVSDHPLRGVEHVLAAHSEVTIGALHTDQIGDGQQVVLAGILSSVLRRVNKAGAPWASAALEDLEGSVEVLFFPQTYAQVAVSIAEDAIIVVKGRVDRREDVAKLIASDVSVPDLSDGPRGPVVVQLQAARCTPPVVERLREVLATHPGTTEVQLQLVNGERRTALRVADGFRVAATPALMGDLKALLGPTCLAS